MSQFECPIVNVTILPHDNADSLELAQIGDYLSVVRKGQFQTGDLVAYIPEQSVLPEYLLKRLGFWDDLNGKGKLHGSAGDRVRAMKLRGVLSQGIVLQLSQIESDWPWMIENDDGISEAIEGGDCSHFLGITKYEPQVPVHMQGRVAGGDLDATIGYDFENIKKHPTLFEDGEMIVITEKIHGTFVQVGLIPECIWEGKKWAEKMETIVINGEPFKAMVTSKGQGAKGLLLDTADAANLYVKAASENLLWSSLVKIRQNTEAKPTEPIFLCGEIFGPGVQDNFAYGQKEITFRAFDIYVGTRSNGYFLDYSLMAYLCANYGVKTVPELFGGQYSREVVASYTDGKTTIGSTSHIREGVVVKTVRETRHRIYGRKIAKSVSEQYLLNGKTTDFQ